MFLETPPSSVKGLDDIMDEIYDEDDLEYVGDLDEVLDNIDDEDDDNNSTTSDSSQVLNDDAICTFNRHKGSVFCGSVNPTGDIAVTGGEDDTVYVWDVNSQNVVFENTSHEDSVIIATFSHDGAYLATGDMGGHMRVVKCPNGESKEDDWKFVWEYQAGDVSWGMWHNAARVLIVGTCSGEVYVWKIPSGDTKVLQGHGSKSECGKLLQDSRRLAVGYEDGTVKIWDLKSSVATHTIQAEGHTNSVTCIDTFHDNNIVASGGLDGKIVLIKSGTGKIVGILDIGSEVEALSFSKDKASALLAVGKITNELIAAPVSAHSSHKCIFVGTLDGSLSIWDVGRQAVRHKLAEKSDQNASGIVTLVWVDQYLAVACLDGSLRIYDSKAGTLSKTYTGHRKEILDLFYSSATRSFLTTSEDGAAKIFKLDLDAS